MTALLRIVERIACLAVVATRGGRSGAHLFVVAGQVVNLVHIGGWGSLRRGYAGAGFRVGSRKSKRQTGVCRKVVNVTQWLAACCGRCDGDWRRSL
jgi:hypothetical protein